MEKSKGGSQHVGGRREGNQRFKWTSKEGTLKGENSRDVGEEKMKKRISIKKRKSARGRMIKMNGRKGKNMWVSLHKKKKT